MAGANGDSRLQFIEIAVGSLHGACWGPQVAPGTPGADSDDSLCYLGGANETRSRNALVFFDGQGRETGRYKFPENPASAVFGSTGSRPNTTGARQGTARPRPSADQNTVLIATDAFAQLPGAPQPQFVMPPLLNAIAGKVCFVGNTEENRNAAPVNLCVSYGPFAGDTEGAGTPAPALPIVDTVSLRRTNGFGNQNADFSRSTTPTPASVAGGTFRIPLAPRVNQGEMLFRNETFGGNGRTCGACHPTVDSGRLTPREIQSKFSTLSTTFDPLFLSETANTGFDFGLNTLTIGSRPLPASGTDFLNAAGGDLRGVITSSNGARAKVLARKSPTQYLVYAGMTPQLNGRITDEIGNEAVVVSLTRGNLEGLETPRLMRTSRSPAFPQGRALILENIDGFDRPAVFRKSPHILNLSRTGPFGFNGERPDLKEFTLDAVRQHFPRTLARAHEGEDPDFRMPTADELSAMEAFQLAQEFPAGSDPAKFNLDRFVTTPAQQRGRALFFGSARCSFCHGGPALATTTVSLLGKGINVNASFNTGVAAQAINGINGDSLPCEPGPGGCNTREFSVPSLFNIRNLAPYFHDSSAATLRDAILFYDSAAFIQSPAGRVVGPILVVGSAMDDLVAFLEAVSAPAADTTLTSASDAVATDAARKETPAGPVTTRTTDGIRLTATTVARGLDEPCDLAVAPDGRLFVAERSGQVRVVRDGRVLVTPLLSIPGFDARGGRGVVAIAVDPEFARTRFIYTLYTTATGFQLSRFYVRGDTATDRAVLIDRLGSPAAEPLATLRFGPDRALYVAIDDGDDARAAGDLGSPLGKVLRLNPDASTPRDQMSGNPVYAVDVGRPRALDWDASGRLWVVEPWRASAFAQEGTGPRRGTMIARQLLPRGVRANGFAIYRDATMAQLHDNLFIGSAGVSGLLRLRARDGDPLAPLETEWLFSGVIENVRALAPTASGAIYVATENAIFRVTAQRSVTSDGSPAAPGRSSDSRSRVSHSARPGDRSTR